MLSLANFALNSLKSSLNYSVHMESRNEILSRLKLLGRIMKGDRLNTRHVFIQPSGYSTSISRTFVNQDNRGNAILFIQGTIDRVFEIMKVLEASDKDSDKITFSQILEDLERAKTGISNLKSTYADDIKTGCDLDILLQTVDSRLREITPPVLLCRDTNSTESLSDPKNCTSE
jgi:hypothetical protein